MFSAFKINEHPDYSHHHCGNVKEFLSNEMHKCCKECSENMLKKENVCNYLKKINPKQQKYYKRRGKSEDNKFLSSKFSEDLTLENFKEKNFYKGPIQGSLTERPNNTDQLLNEKYVFTNKRKKLRKRKNREQIGNANWANLNKIANIETLEKIPKHFSKKERIPQMTDSFDQIPTRDISSELYLEQKNKSRETKEDNTKTKMCIPSSRPTTSKEMRNLSNTRKTKKKHIQKHALVNESYSQESLLQNIDKYLKDINKSNRTKHRKKKNKFNCKHSEKTKPIIFRQNKEDIKMISTGHHIAPPHYFEWTQDNTFCQYFAQRKINDEINKATTSAYTNVENKNKEFMGIDKNVGKKTMDITLKIPNEKRKDRKSHETKFSTKNVLDIINEPKQEIKQRKPRKRYDNYDEIQSQEKLITVDQSKIKRKKHKRIHHPHPIETTYKSNIQYGEFCNAYEETNRPLYYKKDSSERIDNAEKVNNDETKEISISRKRHKYQTGFHRKKLIDFNIHSGNVGMKSDILERERNHYNHHCNHHHHKHHYRRKRHSVNHEIPKIITAVNPHLIQEIDVFKNTDINFKQSEESMFSSDKPDPKQLICLFSKKAINKKYSKKVKLTSKGGVECIAIESFKKEYKESNSINLGSCDEVTLKPHYMEDDNIYSPDCNNQFKSQICNIKHTSNQAKENISNCKEVSTVQECISLLKSESKDLKCDAEISTNDIQCYDIGTSTILDNNMSDFLELLGKDKAGEKIALKKKSIFHCQKSSSVKNDLVESLFKSEDSTNTTLGIIVKGVEPAKKIGELTWKKSVMTPKERIDKLECKILSVIAIKPNKMDEVKSEEIQKISKPMDLTSPEKTTEKNYRRLERLVNYYQLESKSIEKTQASSSELISTSKVADCSEKIIDSKTNMTLQLNQPIITTSRVLNLIVPIGCLPETTDQTEDNTFENIYHSSKSKILKASFSDININYDVSSNDVEEEIQHSDQLVEKINEPQLSDNSNIEEQKTINIYVDSVLDNSTDQIISDKKEPQKIVYFPEIPETEGKIFNDSKSKRSDNIKKDVDKMCKNPLSKTFPANSLENLENSPIKVKNNSLNTEELDLICNALESNQNSSIKITNFPESSISLDKISKIPKFCFNSHLKFSKDIPTLHSGCEKESYEITNIQPNYILNKNLKKQNNKNNEESDKLHHNYLTDPSKLRSISAIPKLNTNKKIFVNIKNCNEEICKSAKSSEKKLTMCMNVKKNKTCTSISSKKHVTLKDCSTKINKTTDTKFFENALKNKIIEERQKSVEKCLNWKLRNTETSLTSDCGNSILKVFNSCKEKELFKPQPKKNTISSGHERVQPKINKGIRSSSIEAATTLFLTKNFQVSGLSSYEKRKQYDQKLRKDKKQRSLSHDSGSKINENRQQVYEVRFFNILNQSPLVKNQFLKSQIQANPYINLCISSESLNALSRISCLNQGSISNVSGSKSCMSFKYDYDEEILSTNSKDSLSDSKSVSSYRSCSSSIKKDDKHSSAEEPNLIYELNDIGFTFKTANSIMDKQVCYKYSFQVEKNSNAFKLKDYEKEEPLNDLETIVNHYMNDKTLILPCNSIKHQNVLNILPFITKKTELNYVNLIKNVKLTNDANRENSPEQKLNVLSDVASSGITNSLISFSKSESSKATVICKANPNCKSTEKVHSIEDRSSLNDSGYLTKGRESVGSETSLSSNHNLYNKLFVITSTGSRNRQSRSRIKKEGSCNSKWNNCELLSIKNFLLYPEKNIDTKSEKKNTPIIKYYLESNSNILKTAINSISNTSFSIRSLTSRDNKNNMEILPPANFEKIFNHEPIKVKQPCNKQGGFINYQKFIIKNKSEYTIDTKNSYFNNVDKYDISLDHDNMSYKSNSTTSSKTMSKKKSLIELFKIKSKNRKKSSLSLSTTQDSLIEFHENIDYVDSITSQKNWNMSLNSDFESGNVSYDFHRIMTLECQKFAKKVRERANQLENCCFEEFKELPLNLLLHDKILENVTNKRIEKCNSIDSLIESIPKKSNEHSTISIDYPNTVLYQSKDSLNNLDLGNVKNNYNLKEVNLSDFFCDTVEKQHLKIDFYTNEVEFNDRTKSKAVEKSDKILDLLSSLNSSKQSEKQLLDYLLLIYDKKTEFVSNLMYDNVFFGNLLEKTVNQIQIDYSNQFLNKTYKKQKKKKRFSFFKKLFRKKRKNNANLSITEIGQGLDIVTSLSCTSFIKDNIFTSPKNIQDAENPSEEYLINISNSHNLKKMANKAKIHLEPLVKATMSNRYINDKMKIVGFLKFLDTIEEGDFTFLGEEKNTLFEKQLKERVANMFDKVYKIANREVFEKKELINSNQIELLKFLVTKYYMGIDLHINILAIYIGQGFISHQTQLEDAILYLMNLDANESVNLELLDRSCQIIKNNK